MSSISSCIQQCIQGPRVCSGTRKEKEMFKCGEGRNESVIVLTWQNCVLGKLNLRSTLIFLRGKMFIRNYGYLQGHLRINLTTSVNKWFPNEIKTISRERFVGKTIGNESKF